MRELNVKWLGDTATSLVYMSMKRLYHEGIEESRIKTPTLALHAGKLETTE